MKQQRNLFMQHRLTKAEAKGKSNCPLCAIGHDANKNKIWNLNEMDADHVTAWSKGGATYSQKLSDVM